MDAFRRYCEEQVRVFDRDRYLAALFAPERHRGAMLALYAFDIALSRVRELAREPMPGEIRLQWWREVVDGKRDGEARAHPVAAALLGAIETHGLPHVYLLTMIDARAFDLYNETFATISDWERYAQESAGTVVSAAAHILAGSSALDKEMARRAGLALTGLRTLLRLPQHLSHGQCFVPLEILDRFGARIEDGLQGRITPEWQVALTALRERIRHALDAGAETIAAVPATVLPALLPCAVMRPALALLERQGYEPLRPRELPQWRRQWSIWRAARNPGRIFQ